MAGEELLDSGPSRRRIGPPGWFAVCAAVALAAVAVLGWQLSGRAVSGRPIAAPTVSNSPPLRIQVPSDSPAVAVDGNVFAILGGALFTVARDGSYTIDRAIADAPYQLIADPARHRVWLVTLSPGQADVRWVDSRHPGAQLGGDLSGMQLNEVALLDSQLFAATGDGAVFHLFVANNGIAFNTTVLPRTRNLAADPSRHRLLLLGLSSSATYATVRAYLPGPTVAGPAVPLPFGKGSVIVAGDAIWAAGFGAHGAILARLDPATLRVTKHSPIESQLGPGALVVGTTDHTLFVRSAAGGDQLWCVDAQTGAAQGRLSAPGAIAAGPDGAFELRTIGLRPQQLDGSRCR